MHLLDILQDLDNPDLFPYGFPEPEDEMYGKYEREIGVLTDERLKKLYALWKNSEQGESNALRHVADAFARGEDARLHMDAATLYKNRKTSALSVAPCLPDRALQPDPFRACAHFEGMEGFHLRRPVLVILYHSPHSGLFFLRNKRRRW